MPMQRLSILIAALWWGGITGLSFLAVPTLFARLGSPTLAGPVAAHLFSLQSWAGLVLGAWLLMLLRRQCSTFVAKGGAWTDSAAHASMVLVALAMLLAMLQEWGVAQQIVDARASGGNLRLWHGIGSALVLAQWLCAGVVLWRLTARQDR
jgi:Domain of unknown function (DUF4149)